MSKTIKIGTTGVFQNQLVVESAFENPEIIPSASSAAAMDLLREKELDIAVVPLEEVPPALAKGLVIAGLSDRREPGYKLVINQAFFQKKVVFRLEQNAAVIADSRLAGFQLLHFRSDVSLTVSGQPTTELHASLSEGSCAALLLSAEKTEAKPEIWQDFHTISLNPREFITNPGQGTLAFLARTEDTDIRKQLLRIHHKNTAEVTNIERKILKLEPNTEDRITGAFGKKDDAGNLHLWTVRVDPQRKTCRYFQISSSTVFKLAEKAVAGLHASKTDYNLFK